jgi:general secretion pathway protein H
MPTSATGISSRFPASAPRGAQSGFTLLEILIVAVIIAVITSMAVISTNVLGRDRQLDGEAARLQAILLEVRDEAMLQGRDVGMRVDARGYDFMRYDTRRERWELETDDPMLKERTLPDGVEAELWLESRRVQLETRVPPPPSPEQQTVEETGQALSGRTELIEEPEPGPDDEQRKAFAPQIVVQASGDLVPFELLLRSASSDETRAIRGTLEGLVEVHDPRAEQRR